jgi:acyl-CoA reductase-like NAD-dependent aldehyde dehydrogenase
MLRRRIEKLEAHLPVTGGKLMDRLDRQALNSLSFRDRELVNEMVKATGRRQKAWSAEHCAADARYLETFGMLLREVSDEDLANLIEQIERELGRPIPELEATA